MISNRLPNLFKIKQHKGFYMNTLETNDDSNIIEIDNKYWHDLYLALKRLEENKDFQKLILETYFKDKAVNLVSMLANQHVVNTNKRGEIMEELVAISRLQDFFIYVKNLGAPAPDDEEDSDSNDLV